MYVHFIWGNNIFEIRLYNIIIRLMSYVSKTYIYILTFWNAYKNIEKYVFVLEKKLTAKIGLDSSSHISTSYISNGLSKR